MMKKKKPFSWRKTILIIFGCMVAAAISAISFVLIVTSDARLDISRLTGSNIQQVEVVSDSGETITTTSTVISEAINENTKNAFIAVEDKRFKEHNGVDFKRIGGALIANIKSGKKSQGASTITQQLVKNTHLSTEKSISRKLKEIKLALEVERVMTKDEIIKAYLDKIYFGNGCIGIEEAANYYFDKSATDLTVAESALLAGLAKAPSSLEPKNHKDKALERKDLVLRLMHNQKLISDDEYETATVQELSFAYKKAKKDLYEDYVEAAKNEACSILNISREELQSTGFKIETFAQEKAFNSLKNNVLLVDGESVGSIVVDSKTGAVKAYYSTGNFNFITGKRQPGSAIKPILVYGPALEEKVVTPESFVLDSKTNFDGYEPKNAGNVYSGWISTRKALSNSKNIPAVKLLQICGIEKAKNYASKAGISFDETDTDLALALGGMTEGTTIIQLAGAYTIFPTGNYNKCCFVKRIIGLNGNVLYEHNPQNKKVFGDDTAYLVYDMMKDCAKTGTAKRLADLPFEVASKTGTVGTENGNTDCYNVSVTSSDIFVVAVTSGSNETIKANGSTTPTITAKKIMKEYYNSNPPSSAIKPKSVVEVKLDSRALEQNKLCLASEETKQYAINKLFSKNNMPTKKYQEFLTSEKVTGTSSKTTYYSIVGKNVAIPLKQRQNTDDLSAVIEQILGL